MVRWIESVDMQSYDPYDLQSTKIVMRLSGILPGRLIQAGLYPLKRFPVFYHPFITKKKAATSSALFASACFMTGRQIQAERELKWLEENACKGYSGFCWGLPFDWMMNKAVIAEAGTPYSTIIIYMIDAFLRGYEATQNKKYLDIACSTASFFTNDLKRTFDDGNKVCLSYSPLDNLHVINVNAYAAASLYTVYNKTKNEKIKDFADKLIRFVISEQNSDGSWYYFSKIDNKENWIDSLHQCYIMENLFRCHQINNNPDILISVRRSFDYYINNFIADNGLISKYPLKQKFFFGTRNELIDISEAIILFTLLGKKTLADNALNTLNDRFIYPGKPFFYSYLIRGKGTSTPFIRWGQAQALYALTYYLTTFGPQKTNEIL